MKNIWDSTEYKYANVFGCMIIVSDDFLLYVFCSSGSGGGLGEIKLLEQPHAPKRIHAASNTALLRCIIVSKLVGQLERRGG
jgi:hypothetical protein